MTMWLLHSIYPAQSPARSYRLAQVPECVRKHVYASCMVSALTSLAYDHPCFHPSLNQCMTHVQPPHLLSTSHFTSCITLEQACAFITSCQMHECSTNQQGCACNLYALHPHLPYILPYHVAMSLSSCSTNIPQPPNNKHRITCRGRT